MAVNDIFKLIDKQTYSVGAQECINVYYYILKVDDTSADAGQLRESWVANVLPTVKAVQNISVTHTAIETINLMNLEDYEIFGLVDQIGTLTGGGEALPAFIALSIMLSRSTRAIRNGHKRYVGMSEGFIGGLTMGAELVGAADDLASQLLLDCPVSTTRFTPIIYGPALPARGTPPVSPRPSPIFSYLSGSVVEGITTQNTRKV